MVRSGLASWNAARQASIADSCAVEPEPLSVPDRLTAGVSPPPVAVGVDFAGSLSAVQAASESESTATAASAPVRYAIFTVSSPYVMVSGSMPDDFTLGNEGNDP